jgi:hypothetical protein
MTSTTTTTTPTTGSLSPHHTTGQPGQSCQSIGVFPGSASSAPGSAFNEPTATSPGGVAGQNYAGNVARSQKNTASVSQYDVACANQVK